MKYSKGTSFGFAYEQYTDYENCYREVTGFTEAHSYEWATDWLSVLGNNASQDTSQDIVWDTVLMGVKSRWVFPARLVKELTELAHYVPNLRWIPPLEKDEELGRLWSYSVAASLFEYHDEKKESWRGYVPALTLQGEHVVLELQVDPVARGVSYEVLREHFVEATPHHKVSILNDYARLVLVCGKYRAEHKMIKLMTELRRYTGGRIQWILPALNEKGEDIVLNLLVSPAEEGSFTFQVIYAYPNPHDGKGKTS